MNLSESGFTGLKDFQDVIFCLMLGFYGSVRKFLAKN
jgi:hypothetical protein